MRQHKHMTMPSRGYALLLAILIANIVLAMSLGVFSIALKEVTLTTYLKDSQIAFEAADLGLECALFWDMSYPQNNMPYTIFSTSTDYVIPSTALYPDYPSNVQCNGMQLPLPASGASWSVVNTPTTGQTSFSLKLSNGTCAEVIVSKDVNGTTVTSNGYNNCAPNTPRRTQRTIEVSKNI